MNPVCSLCYAEASREHRVTLKDDEQLFACTDGCRKVLVDLYGDLVKEACS